VPASLSELQCAMASEVTGHSSPDLREWIRVPEGTDPSQRLAIYRDGYPARIRESLRAAYPATDHILGGRTFDCLAQRYLDGLDAGLRNLNYVGFALPGFLTSDELADELPFLPDLAQLEWAVLECFHSELLEPFDFAEADDWSLADWDRARFKFQPGLALVNSRWPICALRSARATERSKICVELVGHPESALVYRQGFDVMVEPIDRIEALVIARLGQGVSLGRVAAELAAEEVGPATVSGLFTRWSDLGLVSSCSLPAASALD
jgi:hypothetical protein